MTHDVIHGDSRAELPKLPAASFDSVVTDPPYALTDIGRTLNMKKNLTRKDMGPNKRRVSGGFMGKSWDSEIPTVETWAEVLGVLKPGGYAAIFGGTRTYHRLACAVEDAGFEIRDCLMWVYGTGFPKGQGCLKPAWEPILLARKPGGRVLPLGVDACRIGTGADRSSGGATGKRRDAAEGYSGQWSDSANGRSRPSGGRYPANVVHDGSDEVMEAFAAFGERGGGFGVRGGTPDGRGKYGKGFPRGGMEEVGFGDTGTAARFFYTAKASKAERGKGNTHPTVKPLALMRWLVRLVTPPGGRVLDPFAGSGTTLLAAEMEGRTAVGIEQDAGYVEIIRKRLADQRKADGLFAGVTRGQ